MKILRILNPQKWAGQLTLIAFISSTFFFAGMYFSLSRHECPATTQINNDIKNKKGTLTTSTDLNVQSDHACIEWLRSLDMRDIRKLRK